MLICAPTPPISLYSCRKRATISYFKGTWFVNIRGQPQVWCAMDEHAPSLQLLDILAMHAELCGLQSVMRRLVS